MRSTAPRSRRTTNAAVVGAVDTQARLRRTGRQSPQYIPRFRGCLSFAKAASSDRRLDVATRDKIRLWGAIIGDAAFFESLLDDVPRLSSRDLSTLCEMLAEYPDRDYGLRLVEALEKRTLKPAQKVEVARSLMLGARYKLKRTDLSGAELEAMPTPCSAGRDLGPDRSLADNNRVRPSGHAAYRDNRRRGRTRWLARGTPVSSAVDHPREARGRLQHSLSHSRPRRCRLCRIAVSACRSISSR